MVRFSKFIFKKDIYDKFEEFLSKLVWRVRNFVQIVASACHHWSLAIYFLGCYCIIRDHTPSLSQRGGPTFLWEAGSMVLDYAIIFLISLTLANTYLHVPSSPYSTSTLSTLPPSSSGRPFSFSTTNIETHIYANSF